MSNNIQLTSDGIYFEKLSDLSILLSFPYHIELPRERIHYYFIYPGIIYLTNSIKIV